MRYLLVVVVLLAGCRVQEGPGPEKPPEPTRVVSPSNDPLAQRMRAHAGEMASLRVAMTTTDRSRIAVAAREIATKPLVATNVDAASAFPAAFFALQDRMIAAAGTLAKAAHRGDEAALEDAFDELSSTCRSCHAIVRSMQEEPR